MDRYRTFRVVHPITHMHVWQERQMMYGSPQKFINTLRFVKICSLSIFSFVCFGLVFLNKIFSINKND